MVIQCMKVCETVVPPPTWHPKKIVTKTKVFLQTHLCFFCLQLMSKQFQHHQPPHQRSDMACNKVSYPYSWVSLIFSHTKYGQGSYYHRQQFCQVLQILQDIVPILVPLHHLTILVEICAGSCLWIHGYYI